MMCKPNSMLLRRAHEVGWKYVASCSAPMLLAPHLQEERTGYLLNDKNRFEDMIHTPSPQGGFPPP